MSFGLLNITLVVIYKEACMAMKADDRNVADEKKAAVSDGRDDLQPCDKPHTAEAMRNDREDEACDDGVR